ncbi:MAG TPA: ABC transporter permease [Bryobacteraceae bacterium]
MRTLREWFWRVMSQLRRRELDRQSIAEMRFHLDTEIEAGIRRGLTREQAEREAHLRAGHIAAALEDVRDERSLGWLDGAWMDLRHAWSGLRRRPAFLFAAGGALTAAVAINTLIFTVVNGVILRPLPYPAPERLVRVFEMSPRNPKFSMSIFNYLEDKLATRTLASIGLYTRDDLQLMHQDKPERLATVRITDDFLPTLGVSPALGRNFLPAEMRRGVHVVILSHTLWKSRFHADPQIVGKTIRLDRDSWTIVGVLPAGFQHVGGDYRSPLQGDTVALWAPLGLDLRESWQRNWHFTNAVARLKPDVTRKAAEEDLNRIMDDLARRFPNAYSGKRARLEPLSSEVVGRSRLTVEIIAAAGALVLLVACINIAGLSVARVLARKQELAIRQALGGSTWRLIRAVLSESFIVGILGGLLGLGIAVALLPVLHLVIPSNFPRLHEIRFSFAAAGFALTCALLTSAIAGLIPALRQIGGDPRENLSEDNRMTSGAQRITSLRGGLVAAEVALSCILCFGAGLLVRSARLLDARDHGFAPSGVLTFQLVLPDKAYGKPQQISAFYSEIVNRWKSIPGVRAAGLATNVPWTGYDENTSFDIVGRPARAGESEQARFQSADSGFLNALRFRLVSGRWIEPGDQASAPLIVVVNEALAKRYFDNGNPIGQYLDLFGEKRRIAGVVADVRDRPSDAAAEPAFWFPVGQVPFSSVTAVLRTDGNPLMLVSAARAALESLDRELPMAEVKTMDDVTAVALAERHFALWLCEAFAALAMALAAIGMYGMLTYLVEQRRREIGLRLALGSTRPGVLWLVLSNGVKLATFGIVAGLLISPVAGRALSSMLYGVSVWDVPSFLAAPMIILLVTCFGSLPPGWAAARTEPMKALREQ